MAINLHKSERRSRNVMSEINVTPFVDVMLVLLIVFMVTAPMLTVGVPVNLPESEADSLPDAGRVMYRVDTTLYEPKKTTILCGSCGNIAEVDGGRPQMFNCPECGIFLWEDEEE